MIVTDEAYLTPEDIADKLDITVETVQLWLRQGALGGYKIGRFWRISIKDYETFLRERHNRPDEEKGD